MNWGRTMRRLIGVLWVIALIGAAGTAAAAGFDAAKLADVKKAGAAFLVLGKDAYKTGQPPRQSDPAAGKLLDTIFNTDALNGPPPIAFAQFLDVNDWLAQVVSVGLIYVTSGTGVADFSAVTGLTAKQQEQMNANVILFAPEVGRYYDAQLSVSRVEIDLVVGELAAHPDNYKSGTRAQGVAQMRSGLAMTLRGVVTTFQIAGATRPGCAVACPRSWRSRRPRPSSSISTRSGRSVISQPQSPPARATPASSAD
jgi:hypothetical protein